MDVDADEAFLVVWLGEVGVEIHVVRTQFGEAFAAEQIIGQPLDLADRVDAVEDALLDLGTRRRHSVDRPTDDLAAKIGRIRYRYLQSRKPADQIGRAADRAVSVDAACNVILCRVARKRR